VEQPIEPKKVDLPPALRAFAALLALVSALCWSGAAPAVAHSAAGSPSSNYKTTIESVEPSPVGFSVRSIEQGSRLEVRWTSGQPLVVEGYDGEQYLRIGPNGVEENRSSPATYINRNRQGTSAAPESVDPAGPPQWVKVSAIPIGRFHDHRAHFMGSVPPESVTAGPKARQTIQQFDVPILQGSTQHVVSGIVEWIPNTSPWPYLAVAAALAAFLVGVAAWAGKSIVQRLSIRPLFIGALSTLVVVDMVHLAGITGGVAGGSFASRFLSIGYASVAAWVIAEISAVLWVKGRPDALYLTTFAAGLMTLVGGIADVSILSKPSVVFLWSPELARWCVALTLGLGIGILTAAILLTRPSADVTSGQPQPETVGGLGGDAVLG
jgi:hypothetical protein